MSEIPRMRTLPVPALRPLVQRASAQQSKTGQPVRFEITEQSRDTVDTYLAAAGSKIGPWLFPGRRGHHLTTPGAERTRSALLPMSGAGQKPTAWPVRSVAAGLLASAHFKTPPRPSGGYRCVACQTDCYAPGWYPSSNIYLTAAALEPQEVMAMQKSMRYEPSALDKSDGLGRRAFLSKAGGTALAAPVVTSLIISAGATPAFAKSPYGNSGRGPKPKSGHHKQWKIKEKTRGKSAKR